MAKFYNSLFSSHFLTLLFLTAGFASTLYSQNTGYAPFYYNEMDYNPASTGVMPGLTGNMSHRHYFNNSPFSSQATNFHVSFYDNYFWRGAFGVSAHSSTKGESLFKKNQLALFYSKRIMINSGCMLQLGAKGCFVHKKLDSYNSLDFFEYNNVLPSLPHDTLQQLNNSQKHFDFSAGALVVFNIRPRPSITWATTTIGFGVNHINTPKEQWLKQSELTVRMKSNFHMKSRIVLKKGDKRKFVIPAVLYEFNNPLYIFSLKHSEVKALTFGANFEFPVKKLLSCISTGFWVKNHYVGEGAELFNSTQTLSTDSYSFLLGFNRKFGKEKKSNLRFSYSFDVPCSSTLSFNKAIHEFTLAFDLMDFAIPGFRNDERIIHTHSSSREGGATPHVISINPRRAFGLTNCSCGK